MNFFCSLPSAFASEMRYSIIDVVVGFSVFKFQMCGKVIASYSSQTRIAPAKARKMTLVQYHIKLFSSSISYQVNGRDLSWSFSHHIFSTIRLALKSLSCKTQRLTAILNERYLCFCIDLRLWPSTTMS